MEIVCRKAEPGDTPQIILLLEQMREEMPLLPFDYSVALPKVAEFVAEGHVFVAMHHTVVVGSIGLERLRWWSAKIDYLQARWVYLAKRYRRSRAGHMLLKAVRQHAETEGITAMLDVLAFDQVDRKNRLFRRYFTAVGEKFVSGLEYMKD